MFRRIACGTLLCAMVALASGCSNKLNPTTPTAATTTDTFDGSLNPASTTVHPFTTLTGGPITATLTTVGPDSTKTVGFSLGTYNATLNVCTVIFDNPAALQSAVFTVNASTTGYYCVRMYDNGTVAAAAAGGSASSFSYKLTVVHPLGF